MTVVEVKSKRLGVKFVDVLLTGRDHTRSRVEHAVDKAGVNSVEVDAVRVITLVHQSYAYPIPFAHADRRTWNAAVIGPRGELHARHDFDRFVFNVQRVLVKC